MKFRDPLDIACSACGRHVHESIEWLMQAGRTCPGCGASFASNQQWVRSRTQDWDDFVQGTEFILEIETRWRITLSDDDARRLTDAESICEYVIGSLKANRRIPDPRDVRASVYAAAARLGVNPRPDTDLLGPFRRSLDR